MPTSDTPATLSRSPWPRVCSCGESWSESEWAELPVSGRYDAGSDGWIEFRACVCGATLSVGCPAPSVAHAP